MDQLIGIDVENGAEQASRTNCAQLLNTRSFTKSRGESRRLTLHFMTYTNMVRPKCVPAHRRTQAAMALFFHSAKTSEPTSGINPDAHWEIGPSALPPTPRNRARRNALPEVAHACHMPSGTAHIRAHREQSGSTHHARARQTHRIGSQRDDTGYASRPLSSPHRA